MNKKPTNFFRLLFACVMILPTAVGCSMFDNTLNASDNSVNASFNSQEPITSSLYSDSSLFWPVDHTYIIVFHPFSNEEFETLTISHSELQSYSLPKPEKEGNTFDGWYLDKNFNQKYDITKLKQGQNDLYAKYTANTYQIRVHKLDNKIETLSFKFDEKIDISIDYSEHYHLQGYYLDSELSQPFTLVKMPAYDIEIYPSLQYVSKYYTLVFNTNNDEQFDNISVEYRELENLVLPTPDISGYDFDDWYLDKGLRKKYSVNNLKEGDNNLYAKYNITSLASQGMETVYSTNRLDLEHFTFGKALTPGANLVDFPGGYTDYIRVKHGDTIVYGDHIDGIRYIRFVTAYDGHKRVLKNKGSESGTHAYLVPHGVKYVRLSLYSSTMFSDSRINISKTLLRYEPYYEEIGPIGENERRRQEYDELYRPFTTVKASELHDTSYKPLGILKKPYFCLISDDGVKEAATYSIPMAISKGVPMTLGLMRGSEILDPKHINTLRDAVNNHGFEVAQHGWTRYTTYTEDQLNYFFDLEKEYFDSLGFETKSAICPAHSISELVSAVASQRFEALRTGYIGTGDYPYSYGWYANGPTSNVYALDCINISGEPLVDHKKHIVDACQNNWLIIGFYHENELTPEKKAKIESIIDYALEKGMEFCTLSEVPHLSEK